MQAFFGRQAAIAEPFSDKSATNNNFLFEGLALSSSLHLEWGWENHCGEVRVRFSRRLIHSFAIAPQS